MPCHWASEKHPELTGNSLSVCHNEKTSVIWNRKVIAKAQKQNRPPAEFFKEDDSLDSLKDRCHW